MALNSVHGSSLSSASAGVLTTSRHPPPPIYPQSNGHAEAGVKAMKTLIVKTTTHGNLTMRASPEDCWSGGIRPMPAARARLNFFLVDHSPHSSSPTVATSTARGQREQILQTLCPVINSCPAPRHPAVSYRTFTSGPMSTSRTRHPNCGREAAPQSASVDIAITMPSCPVATSCGATTFVLGFLRSRFPVMINPHRLRLSRLHPVVHLNLVAATANDSRQPGST